MTEGRRSSARREQLKRQAAEFLRTRGLRSLTFRALAEELGVAPNTLEHHFGTKDRLLGELIEQLAEEERSRIAEALRDEDLGPMLLADLFHLVLEDLERPENSGGVSLFFELLGAGVRSRDEYSDFLARELHEWVEFISDLLRDRSGMSEDRALAMSYMLISVARGFTLSRITAEEADQPYIEDAIEAIEPALSWIAGSGGDPAGS